jgi:hypothetical protein
VKDSEIYYIVEIKNYFKIRKMPSLYCWKSIESIKVLNDYQRLKTKNAHPIKNILGPKSTIFHNLYIFVIFWYKFRPFGKMVIKSSISNRFQPCYLKTKIIFQFVGSYLYTFVHGVEGGYKCSFKLVHILSILVKNKFKFYKMVKI